MKPPIPVWGIEEARVRAERRLEWLLNALAVAAFVALWGTILVLSVEELCR